MTSVLMRMSCKKTKSIHGNHEKPAEGKETVLLFLLGYKLFISINGNESKINRKTDLIFLSSIRTSRDCPYK